MSTAILTEDQVTHLATKIIARGHPLILVSLKPYAEGMLPDILIIRADTGAVIFQGLYDRCGDFLKGFWEAVEMSQ